MFADNYSIIIIPKDKSRIRRFAMTRTRLLLFLVLVFGSGLFTGLSFLGWRYYHREYVATQDLRDRGFLYEKERRQMISRLEELEASLESQEEFVSKIEGLVGLREGIRTVGLDTEQPVKSGTQLVALDLSQWKKNTEIFNDAALKAASLKTIDLEGEVEEVRDRFERVYHFNRDADYFWSSLPTLWPVRGWVTSNFGMRRQPMTGQIRLHAGLDIASPKGSPVHAPGDGVVTFAGRKGSLGQSVIIDHGYGIASVYGHGSKIFVKRGDTVHRGQLIASVGSTGSSTGSHLHYEIRVGDIPVDPSKYILE